MPILSYLSEQKISVCSGLEPGYARNSDGLNAQSIPIINIHAEITGAWDSIEEMKAEFMSCVASLIKVFDENALCRNKQGRND